MKQFFKNAFFYIITAVALILVIVPIVFSRMGVTPPLENAVGTILAPLQQLFNYGTDAIDGFVSYFRKIDELAQENKALRAEIESLKKQSYEAEQLEKKYNWMSGFLEMKVQHSDIKFLEAAVAGRESNNYSKLLTLSVGSSAGVGADMPIVTQQGIVGKVVEVGAGWSRVETIVNPSSSIGAYVEQTDDSGVCVGVFDHASDGVCSLQYLPQDSKVSVGDRVLSSGYGGIYPRGLVIGYVQSVELNPYTNALDVLVKCSADFNDLSNVMVITSFDLYAAIPQQDE